MKRDGGTSGGAPNGLSARRAFDRWFRYPAGFSPVALDAAIAAVYDNEIGVTADPFAGAASSGTAVLLRGGVFAGIEAHPQIAELAALKFQRRAPARDLVQAAQEVIESKQASSTEGEHELVRRCFDEDILAELVALREAVGAMHDTTWAPYLKWALLATLRDVASVKVGWPYQRPSQARTAPHRSATKRFVERTRWMAEDLDAAPASTASRVVTGDSRQRTAWMDVLQGRSADGCIASPPYLNNFDYADATRLELYFWRIADSWKAMCDSVRAGMLIATTQQTRLDLASSAEEQLTRYPALEARLRQPMSQLEAERTRRSRGKEYDRVMGPYFVGLAGVLSNLFESLNPGARSAWVIGDSAPYGVYVDTPALVGNLATDLGFDVVSDTSIRTRGLRWRTNGVRHQVELSERLLVFRRP